MNTKTNLDNSTLKDENDIGKHIGSKPRIKNKVNPFCFGRSEINSKLFGPNLNGTWPLISVPLNFLFPLRPPPVTPQGLTQSWLNKKPIDKFNSV